MTSKVIRANRRKKRPISKSHDVVQIPLFNERGYQLFQPRDAAPVAPNEGKYKVGDLRIQLNPVPKHPEKKALPLVMDYLAQLPRYAGQLTDLDDDHLKKLNIDWGACTNCFVSVRNTEDQGVTLATYSKAGDRLEISLPPRAVWAKYGLGWLLKPGHCCNAEMHNPTPWQGKQCSCK